MKLAPWLFSLCALSAYAGDSENQRLIEASFTGDAKAVEVLLKQGADANAISSSGNSALIFALYPVARALAEGEKHGLSSGKADAAKALIMSGADPNAVSGGGESALELALVRDENIQLSELLLEKGANINQVKGNALVEAAASGDAKSVTFLLSHGASVGIRSEKGMTPLLYASVNGHIPVLKALLKAGAEPDAKDHDGHGSLWLVSIQGMTDAMKILLDAGADPNPTEADGSPLLLVLACNGSTAAIKVLLQQGVDVRERGSAHNSPRDCATTMGHSALAEILAKAEKDGPKPKR